MKFLHSGLPVVVASMLFAAGCDIDQTQQGELPDVDMQADAGKLPKFEVVQTEKGRMPDIDVDVKGGQLPHFDVEGPSVSVNEKDVTVSVPDVDVDIDTEEKTFSVPTIDVDLPQDEDDSPQR